jgi:NADH dehydrogenase FAD-containing subunit
MFDTTVNSIKEDSVTVTTDGKDKNIKPVRQAIVAVGVTPRTVLKEMLQKMCIRHFIIVDTCEGETFHRRENLD